MKIAIVTSGGLPVPNVKGGGAETLITALLDMNENTNNEIIVYSIYDSRAIEVSKKYHQAENVFWRFSKRVPNVF